jgi:hypothetical protein
MSRIPLAFTLIVLLQLSVLTCFVDFVSADSYSEVYIPSFGYLRVIIFSPEEHSYVTNPVNFTVAAGVHSGILDSFQYSVDGGTWVALPSDGFEMLRLNLSSGFHFVAASAEYFGKRVYVGVAFAVDVVSPYVTTLSPENKTYNSSDIPLIFEASDSRGKRYSLDDQRPVYVEGNTTVKGISDGGHSLVLYGDSLFGTVFASDTVWFEVDTQPPKLTVFPIENKTYDTPDAPLIFTVDNSASWVGYSLDKRPNVTLTGNLTLTGLFYGLHELTVYANDAAGNVESETLSFAITEPFPTTLFISVVALATVIGATLLVRFKKHKRSETVYSKN